MSYQSIPFILFSAVVLLAYYLVAPRHQQKVLACANLAFFAIAGIKYIPFLVVTMTATFFTGKKMGDIYREADAKLSACTVPAQKKEVRAAAKKQAKKYLQIGMFVTLALLVVCKYTGFLTENLNVLLRLFHLPQVPMFGMILPLGISFYSFMALSYVLDIYWKRYPAEQSFLSYAVYLSYFPHLVQGPIDRFSEFKAQIADGVPFCAQNLIFGAQLALWGFFKKLVVADRLGLFVDHVFTNWNSVNGIIIAASLIAYSIQIYADFSGCIDIVTGVSEMFGIRLRKNFNHPYFSRSMPEFWRRWHISLQEWFKDYIYYPVSASAFVKNVKKHYKNKNQLRAMELFSSCFPILVVWLVTGIWHGAAWKFVVWGLFHAALLIGGQIFAPLIERLTQAFHIDTENFGWHLIQMTRTFLLCCLGRLFFRAEDLMTALRMLYRMLTHSSAKYLFQLGREYGMSVANVQMAIVAVFVLWAVDMLQERMHLREVFAKQNVIFRWILVFAAVFSVIIFGIYGPGYNASTFIYEQF